MPVRILIADREAVYRAGLRALLERDPRVLVVGEAAHGAGVIKAKHLWETDVLLLDSDLPGPPNPRGIVRMLQYTPKTNILVIAMSEDRWCVQDLLRAGARGCILKESTEDELLKAVHLVAAGEPYVDPEFVGRDMAAPDAVEQALDDGSAQAGPFTSREQEVFELLVNGATHAEIAEKLGISKSAVEGHRHDIMTKLGLESRADLVHFAVTHGLWKTE